MLLNVRSISITSSVIIFFIIAIVGWCSALSPLTCCKRSLIAAVIAYAITACAVKLINAILMNAIVNSQTNQQKKELNNSGN